jgi:hypothetical protein
VSEGIDGCESAKNEPDDIEKDDTDVTGQKEVMGGSVQVDDQFSHDNIDESANDQSKYQPDPKIGTEIPKGPESECKDGGDTSINVPGDNVPTDVISPPEGASEEKSDESPVLPSNAPLRGKALQFQQFLEAKKQQEEQKKTKKRKNKEKKKRKRRNQREIKSNYFLLQRAGLDICKLKWPGNFSTMMFSPCTCATLFKMTLIH